MTLPPIKQLCADLCAEFERDPAGPRAAEILEAYTGTHDDWRDYAFFSEDSYTRNLVHADAVFELMVVCWDQGQQSPIHNHAGSNCWMGVLQGSVEEQHYDLPKGEGELIPTRSRLVSAGKVAFIRDEIALHLVREAGGSRAASLHLYSTPIPECQIYCPDTGRVESRTMKFHSIEGERVTAG